MSKKHKDSQNLSTMIAVRVSPEQYAVIARAAKARKLSVSAYCRACAATSAILGGGA